MTQIIVTLEEGTNMSIIDNAIKLIKEVKSTLVTHMESGNSHQKAMKRLETFDRLAGSVKSDMVDMDDDRTKYLLS
ncbi:MAG: hypothetical protein NC221_02260 [Duncaniella sp.]|nr:hypothetical protein [Duncaniella sp.]